MFTRDEADFKLPYFMASGVLASRYCNLQGVLLPLSEKIRVDLQLKVTPPTFEENISVCKDDIELTSVPSYPRPYVFAKLAFEVYTDYQEGESFLCYQNRLDLPTGWKLLATASNSQITNGYFGAAFWHPENHQVIIAHRGSVINWELLMSAHVSDIISMVFNNYVAQISSASTFADKVVESLSKFNEGQGVDFQLFFTGHSLGGWLAQVTTLTIEHLFSECEFFQRVDPPKPSQYHAHTVVFDSPGCAAMLSQIIAVFDGLCGAHEMAIGSFDITSYLSAPNRINTCNAHVGKIYRIFTNLCEMSWLEQFIVVYNFASHCMAKILEEFDSNTGNVRRDYKSGRLKLVEVVDWPLTGFFTSRTEYKTFVQWVKCIKEYHSSIFEQEFRVKSDFGYAKCRYETKFFDKTSCPLNVFTDMECQFLECYFYLRELPGSFEVEKLFDASDKYSKTCLKDFKIKKNTICCPTSESLQKVIPYVKRLLRRFPAVFDRAEHIMFSDKVIRGICQLETGYYIDKANEMILSPVTDNLGLKNFLNLDNHSVMFQTIQQDTSFALKWTVKICEQIKQQTPFGEREQYTVLTLKRFNVIPHIINQVQRLFKTPAHVFIIDCNVLEEWTKRNIHKLLNSLSNDKNMKLILIIQSNPTTDEWTYDLVNYNYKYVLTKFPNLYWEDLSSNSQKYVLNRRVTIQGKSIPFYNFSGCRKLDCLHLVGLFNSSDDSIIIGSDAMNRRDFPQAYVKQCRTIHTTALLKAIFDASRSKTLFIISGLKSALPKELMQSLKHTPVSQQVVYLKKRVSHKLSEGKNIIITVADYSEEDFRSFCNDHPTKKVLWVSFSSKRWLWRWLYDPDFYFERTMKQIAVNSVIKQRLLSNSSEIFIFFGMSSEKYLWQFLELTSVELQKVKKSSKVILANSRSDAESQFNNLTYGSSQPVSVLNFHEEFSGYKLLWHCINPSKCYTLYDNFTLLNKEPVVIIADEPGAGKSTTLRWIKEQRQQNAWIMHINLKNCGRQLSHLPTESPSLLQVIDFLWTGSQDSSNILAESLFYNHFTSSMDTSFPLLFLIDGFDEISQYDQQKIEALLRVIIDTMPNSRHQVVVATSEQPEIEKHLEVPFTLQFTGLSQRQQRQFLKGYWRKSSELLLNEPKNFDSKFNAFMDAVFLQAENILKEDSTTLLCIPMQLRLLAETLQDEFVHFANSTSEFLLDFDNPLTPALYKRFIEVKHDLYFKENSNLVVSISPEQIDSGTKRTLQKCHNWLAVQNLFPEKTSIVEDIPTCWLKKSPKQVDLVEISRVGLVQRAYGNGDFEFVHRRFAEYFFADFLLYKLSKSEDLAVQNFLLEHILLESRYKGIRLFLNGLVGNIVNDEQLKALGMSIDRLWSKEKLRDQNGNTILHIACEENNFEIICFLFKALAYQRDTLINLLEFPGLNKRTALHCAAISGNTSLVNTLLDEGAESNAIDCNGITPLIEAIKSNAILSNGSTPLMEAIKQYVIDYNGTIPLFDAVKKHELVVQILIDRGANVNAKTYMSLTALHYASTEGFDSIVKILLKNGARVNDKTNDDSTALHFAAFHGFKSIVKTLLEYGAEVNATDVHQNTPLIQAAKKGRRGATEVLIDGRAYLNVKTGMGLSPLHFAASGNYYSVAKVLLANGAEANAVDDYGSTPLLTAAEKGNNNLVILLIEWGANVNAKAIGGLTGLHFAALGDYEMIIRTLVGQNAHIDAIDDHGSTPLIEAAKRGHEDSLNLLLGKGSNVKAKTNTGQTALHFAVLGVYESIVRTLLENGADVDAIDDNGSTPLIEAAKKGHEGIIKVLIDEGANVNIKTKVGQTALNLAVVRGYQTIVWFLSKNGADVNAIDENGSTPLIKAAKNGHVSIVKNLMDKGANVSAKTKVGQTALHVAALGGYEWIVKTLLENGADIDAIDDDGNTPLIEAAKNGHEGIFKVLIGKGANVNAKTNVGRSALHALVSYESIIKILLENGADVDAIDDDGSTPLIEAAKGGHEGVVKVLLCNGASVHAKTKVGQTALHVAALGGYESIVKTFLENGTDVDAIDDDGSTPLMEAAKEGREGVVKVLICNGASVHARTKVGQTALHVAALGGYESIVKTLLENGVDIDAIDDDGNTPLIEAAKEDREALVEVLLGMGSNVNAKTKVGQTALHFAVVRGHHWTILKLLNNGANVDDTDDYGNTPLIEAAKDDDKCIVNILIAKGANVNAKTHVSVTALHAAALVGCEPIVKTLLENGADIDAIDDDGSTPLILAVKNGHDGVVKVLINKGANVNAKTKMGQTAFNFAVVRGYRPIIWFLVRNGADASNTEYFR